MTMSLAKRLTKLESFQGIGKINTAHELKRLKKLAQSGEKMPVHSVSELKKLIAESTNDGLIKLYRASIRAIYKTSELSKNHDNHES